MPIVLGILLFLSILPINYFFETSFNAMPIQVACALLSLSCIFKTRFNNAILLTVSTITLLLLSRLNIGNFITSPITGSFSVMVIIMSLSGLRTRSSLAYSSSIVFVYITGLFTLFYNISFWRSAGPTLRSRGFGSGTIYSLFSIYCITLLYCLLKRSAISSRTFYLGSIPFIWALLLTQSRGAILTLILAILYVSFRGAQRIKWSRIAITLTALVTLIITSGVADRFVPKNYDSLEQFTSGRLTTQAFILGKVFSLGNYEPLLIGFGLNSLKQDVYSMALELPHLDALYLLYDGGLILVLLYALLLKKIYTRFETKILFWIFIISSLHTNMILSPGFLMLGKVLDVAIETRVRRSAPLNRP